MDYEAKVLNRVAFSVGCQPQDLDREEVLKCFFDGYSQFEAARVIENNMNEEYIKAFGVIHA